MNLALDIGNTRHKIGLFDGVRLLESKVATDWSKDDLIAYCNQNKVSRIIISSVSTPDSALNDVLSLHFELLELTHETPLPFINQYTTPLTLGKDRLAAVAGAQALLPDKDCLIIDCGTCIKYDLLTKTGTYLGGNIAPGLQMRTKAMHVFTARLPEVPLLLPQDFIGVSTESALQNGAFRGAALEVKGFVTLFQERFSALKVILTGGDAVFFQAILNLDDASMEQDLTLYGLNNILIFNR
jgi:type III pantothenate kinase